MSAEANLETALRYLTAIEAGAVGPALAEFLDPAIAQIEYPNRLVPNGNAADLAGMLVASERGQRAVANQRYAVRNTLAAGDQVAIEVSWSAELKVPLGQTPAGGTLQAELAVFLVFRDGRIVSQHNYDCFRPF
jgi:ketosteroid isomerase-like protein